MLEQVVATVPDKYYEQWAEDIAKELINFLASKDINIDQALMVLDKTKKLAGMSKLSAISKD
ncbi:MAG TPA: hypothetical protein PK728_04715 [Bacillota bacterium]|nr:hypothetical protein [Bacillota bacterium]